MPDGWASPEMMRMVGQPAGAGGLPAHLQPLPMNSDRLPLCPSYVHTSHGLTHLRGTRSPVGRTVAGAAFHGSDAAGSGVHSKTVGPCVGAESEGLSTCSGPQVRAFLQPPLKGVVMETFGSGNGPTKPDLLQELRAAAERGLIILNCTHCLQGTVTSDYAAGMVGVGRQCLGREGLAEAPCQLTRTLRPHVPPAPLPSRPWREPASSQALT